MIFDCGHEENPIVIDDFIIGNWKYFLNWKNNTETKDCFHCFSNQKRFEWEKKETPKRNCINQILIALKEQDNDYLEADLNKLRLKSLLVLFARLRFLKDFSKEQYDDLRKKFKYDKIRKTTW